MTWAELALADIRRQEACVLRSYWDDIGDCWTRGYGHTGHDVAEGQVITPEAAEADLHRDFTDACADLDTHAPWWTASPDPVRRGLANMSFEMGWPRLAGFSEMLKAGAAGDYARMADEGLASHWARQVPSRAKFVTDLFRSAVLVGAPNV